MSRSPSPPEFFVDKSLGGREGWIVLTKDRRIRYRPAEIAAIRRFRVKVFVITSGNLTAADQASRVLANAGRIEAACVDAGPFLHAVYRSHIARIFPT